jgi:hypothetical protein
MPSRAAESISFPGLKTLDNGRSHKKGKRGFEKDEAHSWPAGERLVPRDWVPSSFALGLY